MSKAFTTGTIAQPDAGSVGLAMVESIRDDLTDHPAWELVEEFTPASGAVRWYVFKNLASESGLPSDWYAVIGRTLSSGKLSLTYCEEYNAGTHTMSFFSVVPTSSFVAFDALGRYPKNFVLGTQELVANNDWPLCTYWTPNGVSTKWWLIVNDDGFTVAFNGASNAFMSVTTYIPLTPLPIDLPLLNMGANGNWGIVRNPSVAGANVRGYATVIDPSLWSLGFYGRFDVNDRLQDNKRVVAELAVRMGANYNGAMQDPADWGSSLGKYKNLRFGTPGSHPVTFSFGDAYVVDGTLWVPYHPSDSRIWDTGVVA